MNLEENRGVHTINRFRRVFSHPEVGWVLVVQEVDSYATNEEMSIWTGLDDLNSSHLLISRTTLLDAAHHPQEVYEHAVSSAVKKLFPSKICSSEANWTKETWNCSWEDSPVPTCVLGYHPPKMGD